MDTFDVLFIVLFIAFSWFMHEDIESTKRELRSEFKQQLEALKRSITVL